MGVDIDPVALLMARANASVLGYADRLRLILADYRTIYLPACDGKTLFIGNPPYVRHHQIADHWKKWYTTTANRYGHKASKLAGLHIHFFLKTRELAKRGDFGAFIAPDMGQADQQQVVGVHINAATVGFIPRGEVSKEELATFSEVEKARLARMQNFLTEGNGYFQSKVLPSKTWHYFSSPWLTTADTMAISVGTVRPALGPVK